MDLFEYISDRWDRLALQGLLHVSAVVQCTILTVPSFALLGLLIPVFGLGANTWSSTPFTS